ncbi:O-antigen ligase family protein [Sinomonas sp. RB5]
MMFWWLMAKFLQREPPSRGVQPVRLALHLLVIVIVASYVLAMFRGIPDTEVSPADNALLRAAGWCGILLVAHDGLRSARDIKVVLRRVVTTGAIIAAIGILQFATKQSLVNWIVIPGMTADGQAGVDTRGEFTRAAGTGGHPLEYAVVICMTLPLSLTFALEDRTRGVLSRWAPPVVIATAALLSVSRSAIIALVVGIVFLLPSWAPRVRLFAGIAGVLLFTVIYFAVPGIAGTIRGMFTGAGDDSSVLSRTNAYDVAFTIASNNAAFGRGLGTFLPAYTILDNQYLGLIIEIGYIGAAVFLALIVAAIFVARSAVTRATDSMMRQLGVAAAASVAAGSSCFAFFDALSFPMSAAFLFLMMGIAGALAHVPMEPTVAASPRSALREVRT